MYRPASNYVQTSEAAWGRSRQPIIKGVKARYRQLAVAGAKRRALDEIAARQRAADEKRQAETERREQGLAVSQPAVIQ